MAEFPDDICRLVNQYVPWDRHHRSPVAQIVKSHLFKVHSSFFLNQWRLRYEICGAVHHGLPAHPWDKLPEILSPDEEANALRDTERYMLENPNERYEEETETEEETDTEEEEETDESD